MFLFLKSNFPNDAIYILVTYSAEIPAVLQCRHVLARTSYKLPRMDIKKQLDVENIVVVFWTPTRCKGPVLFVAFRKDNFSGLLVVTDVAWSIFKIIFCN